jgi:hypothetical protein
LKLYFFLCFALLTLPIYSDIENLNENLHLEELNDSILFVSLGSFCHPSHDLREYSLRRAAFPFDWIISFNGEALITILDEDFSRFLNENDFDTYNYALLNTHYELEFLHDGNFTAGVFSGDLENLKSKYKRRINRFRKLRTFKGKVYFIRQNNPHSLTDPHRFFFNAANVEITEEYAFRLYAALKRYFPTLDFSLIIRNVYPSALSLLEKKLHNHLFMIQEKEESHSAAFEQYLTQFLD